jgi:hypothetical protein
MNAPVVRILHSSPRVDVGVCFLWNQKNRVSGLLQVCVQWKYRYLH